MAQSVAHFIGSEEVTGSIPVVSFLILSDESVAITKITTIYCCQSLKLTAIYSGSMIIVADSFFS